MPMKHKGHCHSRRLWSLFFLENSLFSGQTNTCVKGTRTPGAGPYSPTSVAELSKAAGWTRAKLHTGFKSWWEAFPEGTQEVIIWTTRRFFISTQTHPRHGFLNFTFCFHLCLNGALKKMQRSHQRDNMGYATLILILFTLLMSSSLTLRLAVKYSPIESGASLQ